MNELYFVGVDVAETTRKLMHEDYEVITNGMTKTELMAYNLGIENTISALKTIMETANENEVVIHIDGLEVETEFTTDDSMKMLGD